jgi:predicted ATPase
MIEQTAAGKSLPVEVIEQIRLKTDGVPLFVEELTKAVVEAESAGARQAVPLQTIPATLQEALLARLDRLSEARQIAQLGATLGREFSHELLQAVAPLSETDLHTALSKLVEAEILYQRGVGEQARYFFKHALIQDTAYQSLLKSTRQQYHQKIARVLEERFPDTKETQPELLAHHYTEANLSEQAIPYWQQAGQRAVQRSANVEAINHLTKGLDLLKTLADNPEHARQELNLQSVLGTSLVATRGYATPEVEEAYTKALALCQRMGETPQIFPVLRGLRFFYNQRAELQRAYELGEQMLRLAQRLQDTTLLVEAHAALGATLFARGELTASQAHVEQGTALYDLQQHRPLTLLYGQDAGVTCLEYASWTLWALGYPDQALKKSQEAIALAQELSHPFSLAFALGGAVLLRQIRRAWQENQDQTERMMTLCHEQGFRFVLAVGTIQRGWVLAEQGQAEEGIAQIHQGIVAMRATGSELGQPHRLGLLAEVYGKEGWAKEGLTLLAEALAAVDRTGERSHEADLYRLKGDLTLQQQFQVSGSKFQVAAPQPLTPDPQGEAEACFRKALDIARQQQAKSWELRASTSLARLWQQQGKRAEAHKLLSGIYNWFTEGFDTKDLQEAKALLEELS